MQWKQNKQPYSSVLNVPQGKFKLLLVAIGKHTLQVNPLDFSIVRHQYQIAIPVHAPRTGISFIHRAENHMNFIIWIVIGGIIGWLASMVMKTNAQQGIFLNIVVGIVGAFLGAGCCRRCSAPAPSIVTISVSPPCWCRSWGPLSCWASSICCAEVRCVKPASRYRGCQTDSRKTIIFTMAGPRKRPAIFIRALAQARQLAL